MTVSVKAETQILLGLIALFSVGAAVSLWLDQTGHDLPVHAEKFGSHR